MSGRTLSPIYVGADIGRTSERVRVVRRVTRKRIAFGQGHDVNFLDIADWIATVPSLGGPCRAQYFTLLRTTLARDDASAELKVA